MRLVVLALLALSISFALAPATAQFVSRPGEVISIPAPGGPGYGFDSPIYADIRIETPEKDVMPFHNPWLLAGHDTVLNLTVRNNRDAPLNTTFRLNVTGATVTPGEFTFSLAAYGFQGQTFVVHPEDVGNVEIVADAIDTFQPSGDPVRAILVLPALSLPSMRFLDPPETAVSGEDDEFITVNQYGGHRAGYTAYLRLRPGESIAPRLELTNPFDTSIAGFRLQLQIPTQQLPAVEVEAMEPRETRIVEFEEFTPLEDQFGGGGYYGGPMGNFELRPMAEVNVGGAQLSAAAAAYRIERGAVVDVRPAVGMIEVQDGLAIDLLVPRKPVLGTPTRIGYNLTNLGTQPAQGRLILQIMTPGGLFYEVQGPETHQVNVALGPGERSSGSVDFTPRVTGSWQTSTTFRSSQGFGYGGGGSFEVKGPLVIAFDRTDQVFARIGEPIEVGISIATTETLQDAQLRVTSGSGYSFYRDPAGMTGSDYRPGFAGTLIQSRSLTSTLGTLRPGGTLNASVEVVGRSSGYYNIAPYVVAEGFAYTSTPTYDPNTPIPFYDGMMYSATMLNVIVQARPIPAALSLAPLTVALAFFVGAWTLRTRFVK